MRASGLGAKQSCWLGRGSTGGAGNGGGDRQAKPTRTSSKGLNEYAAVTPVSVSGAGLSSCAARTTGIRERRGACEGRADGGRREHRHVDAVAACMANDRHRSGRESCVHKLFTTAGESADDRK
jgi:hypothetical protein